MFAVVIFGNNGYVRQRSRISRNVIRVARSVITVQNARRVILAANHALAVYKTVFSRTVYNAFGFIEIPSVALGGVTLIEYVIGQKIIVVVFVGSVYRQGEFGIA